MSLTIPTPTPQTPLALPWQLPLLCLCLLLLKALQNRYLTNLNTYPGPPLAGYTNLWRLLHNYTYRHSPPPVLSLHEEYGPIVRIGPRCLSFADPAAIASFNKLSKSEFYPVGAPSGGGRYIYTLFSGTDVRWHDRLRKSVNWIFTPQAVSSYEMLVDQTLVLFLKELGNRFTAEKNGGGGKRRTFDLSEWFAYFTFDFIGDLTYNRRYGFLAEGRDVDGIIGSLTGYLTYGGIVCIAALSPA